MQSSHPVRVIVGGASETQMNHRPFQGRPPQKQRATPRRPVHSLRVLTPTEGEVINFSERGLCLETISWLAVGRTCNLKLARYSQAATVVTEVRWCRLIRTVRSETFGVVPIYAAGVQLDGTESQIALQRLVD